MAVEGEISISESKQSLLGARVCPPLTPNPKIVGESWLWCQDLKLTHRTQALCLREQGPQSAVRITGTPRQNITLSNSGKWHSDAEPCCCGRRPQGLPEVLSTPEVSLPSPALLYPFSVGWGLGMITALTPLSGNGGELTEKTHFVTRRDSHLALDFNGRSVNGSWKQLLKLQYFLRFPKKVQCSPKDQRTPCLPRTMLPEVVIGVFIK